MKLRSRLTVALAAVISLLTVSAAAAQQGTISGRVTDATTGLPIPTAQVRVVGSNAVAQTNADGVYTLRGVAPGRTTVRVLMVGYGERTQPVAVAAGQTATLNFVLQPAATALDPIVVTATGEQRRMEVGNAIAQIQATKVVETSAVTNVGDLLTARTAGVLVVPGTQTGAGTRIRIRGTSSLSLSNDPIVFIDGVRVESSTGQLPTSGSSPTRISVGGTQPSRLGDLNPEEIESVEVVRGPSAATLYGTDAANGVIVIRTKRGIAGPPQWTYYTEQTAITDRNDYPTAYTGWRTGTTASTTTTRLNGTSSTAQCFLTRVAAGICSQDSVTTFNPTKDSESTPFGVGYRQQHGLQLRGGSEAIRYFLHGEWEDEDGVTKVPEFERQFLASRGLSLRPEQENPNGLNRITGRANVNIALPRNSDIAVSAGYTSQDLQLPRSDDSGTPGLAANIYGGPGFKYNLNQAGDTLFGYREFTPREVYRAVTTQSVERMTGSIAANWRPQDWLALRSNAGLDYTNRHDTQLCRLSECPALNNAELGFKADNRTNLFVYTLDAAATATRRLSENIESETTAGIQFYRNIFNRNGARGERLPAGATTVTAGALAFADESYDESRTLGGYVEQRVNLRERLFLTAAVRSDRNSAFGTNFSTVFYPKFSASWVISDEPFFPASGFLDQLRFRAAYGASGVQPTTLAALQYFSGTAALGESGERPALVFSTLGNADLRPERSTEFEAGVDGRFWNSRISTELTFYNKVSRDALVERVLAPSIGTGVIDRFENLGEVRNRGWEALINAQLLQSPAFGWDVTLNGSTNSNELVSLGGLPPIVQSSTLRQVEGYPLNGWWSRRLVSFEDKDDNRIITVDEIVVSDEAEFHGYSAPRYEATVINGFDFWQRRVRLTGMVDYKGGHLVYNNSERIRCSSRNNCQGLIDPNASLFEQARTVAVREHRSRTVAGFFEEGDFLRLRELSLAFTPEGEWIRRLLPTRSVTAALAARNVGILWTKYTGVDPEAFGTTGDAPSSFQAFAPPTYYTLRLSIGF